MSGMRECIFTTIASLILTPFVLFCTSIVSASMQSTNYRVQSDSVNAGGGFSSTSNRILESTVGEVATGESSSATYVLKAGYQQMHEVYIALTGASNIAMTPSIAGVTGGTANGSTTVTVTTDSASGYELTIASSLSPAMHSDTDTIADYTPIGSNPDMSFGTGASDAHFGYTPSGGDIPQRFKDDGFACNTNSLDTALACWDGLSTTGEVVARDTSANHPSGATTTISFRVWVGGSVVQSPGTYTATTTLTALPL